MKLKAIPALFCALLLGTITVHAQTFVWTGLAGDNDIENGTNWVGGVAPTGSGGENLAFSASGGFNPVIYNPFSVTDISVTPGAGFYNLYTYGMLTLNGNITIQSGATNAMLMGGQMTLAAGTHTFNTAGADLYMFNDVSGAGNIIKTGTATLIFDHEYQTFTGNVTLQQGRLLVHGDDALGTGQLIMAGGTLVGVDYYDDCRLSTLSNSLSLGASANFGENGNNASITFTGATTIQAGVGLVAMHVRGNGVLTLTDIGETTLGSGLSFDGGGQTLIAGTSTYTGNTTVSDGMVIFDYGALPAGGNLKVLGNAYLGSRDSTNVQTNFLDRFNKAATDGIIGLDSLDPRNPTYIDEDLDLTGFNSGARLGTSTFAIVDGNITPQGSVYQFGGIGAMYVDSDLTGSRSVSATDGIQLILGGDNDYDGGTYAHGGGAVIFDSDYSLPGTGLLSSSASGYIGASDGTSFGVPGFLGAFDVVNTHGVVGFDSEDVYSPFKITEDINLTGFDSNVFLGTSTALELGCTITITPAGGDYRFTGFRDGQLTVESHLTGSYGVTIGLDGNDIASHAPLGQTFNPSVTLTGDNDYTGGTTLQSGELIVGQSNGSVGIDPTTALGTGPLTINYNYVQDQPAGLAANAYNLIIPNDIVFNSSYGFYFGGDYDYTLAGSLSGSGTADKTGYSTVTFTGDNSGAFVDFNLKDGWLIFATDTAFGNGQLNFSTNEMDGQPGVSFQSTDPVINGLSGGYTRNGEGTYGSEIDLAPGTQLTINQSFDSTYAGQIWGSGDSGIVKTGTGSLTLTGPASYDGPTAINQGTLVVSGQDGYSDQLGYGAVAVNGGILQIRNTNIFNPSSIDVNSGGTLQGVGAIWTNVTLNSGSTIAPGLPDAGGTGRLTIGDLTLKGGAAMAWNLINPTTYSQVEIGFPSTLHIDSSVTSGTPFILRLISLNASGNPGIATGFLNQSYTWTLFDASASSVQGYIDPTQFSIDSSQFMTDIGAGYFTFDLNSNRFELTFTPVPEPSTYALLGVGLVAVVFPALRRRKRS